MERQICFFFKEKLDLFSIVFSYFSVQEWVNGHIWMEEGHICSGYSFQKLEAIVRCVIYVAMKGLNKTGDWKLNNDFYFSLWF